VRREECKSRKNGWGWHEYNNLLQDLFGVLSSIGRIPWLEKDFLLLCGAVVNLHLRAPADGREFQPDLRMIFGQQQQAAFELSENWWMESETPTLHFLANPIISRGWQPEYSSIYELMKIYQIDGESSYSEIVSFNLGRSGAKPGDDASLFLCVVSYWQLGRHTWEPILHMKTAAIDRWMHSEWDLDEIGWKRLMALAKLASDLEHQGYGPGEQSLLMRKDFGHGTSPMQLIEQGQVDSEAKLCRNAITANSLPAI